MDNTDVCGLLKGVDLFSELTEEQLGLLANLVVVQDFNRDETVVLEGDCSMKALYLIASAKSYRIEPGITVSRSIMHLGLLVFLSKSTLLSLGSL